MATQKIILSLGGSIVVPDHIQTDFLKQFRSLILEKIEQDGYQFVIFVGGGKTCRVYQEAAREIVQTPLANEELDWIGIYTSWLNARLIKSIFQEYAAEEIIIDPTQDRSVDKPITIGGGWKPGWSTDYDAVAFAQKHGFNRVINLSNILYAYDKDPNQFADAKPLTDVKWANFRKIVGDTWTPGLNMPFDPIASKLAQEADIEVVIAQGTNLDNLRFILEDKSFTGTRIHN